MRIVAVSEAALSLGIGPGLMLADARARVPDLLAVPHDTRADAALLDAIADDCDRYTPMVARDPPDGLILDITGCAHIWHDEAGLVSSLAARLAHRGFTLRLALAETPDKARALARHGQGQSLSLPVACLDLEESQTTALRRAGLYTVGDLASRPRAPLAARFGMAAVSKLARVLGEEDVRITPRRVPPALFVMRRFAEPVVHTDFVLDVIHDLAAEAARELRARGEGGRRFVASLFRSDGDVRRLGIETGAPTRDPALLLRLLRERIESLNDPLDPGFGYDAVRLDIAITEPLGAVQTGLEGDVANAEAVSALVDRLGVRIGTSRIRRFAAGNSHIPELASLMFPANSPALPLPWPRAEPGEPPLRPLHLFDPPQRVEVIAEVPDGPPRRFRWRRVMHDVVAHEGPERIASEWWKRKAGHESGKGGLTRDYFRVEDGKGHRFWLFRHGLYGVEAGSPDWYLHGMFA